MCDKVRRPEALVLRVGDLLFEHSRGQLLGAFVAPLAHEASGYGKRDAAGYIEIAEDGSEDEYGVAGLHAVAVRVDGESPHERGGMVGGDGARCRRNGFGGNPSDLFDLVERILGRAFLELIEPVAPVLDEIVVVEVFLDDEVDHAEAERGVGAGTQLQMIVGVRCHPGDARIDDDVFGSAFHEVDKGMAEEAVGVREKRVFAPEHDVLRHFVTRIVESIGEERRIVEFGIARS